MSAILISALPKCLNVKKTPQHNVDIVIIAGLTDKDKDAKEYIYKRHFTVFSWAFYIYLTVCRA